MDNKDTPDQTDVSREDSHELFELNPEDQTRVDQLFEHGFDSQPQAPESDDPRINAISTLIGLLDTPVQDESNKDSRIDLIKVLANRIDQAAHDEPILTQEDQIALDQYIDSQYQLDSVEHSNQERAQKCHSIGELILTNESSSDQTDSRSELVESTLSRIQSHIDQEESSRTIQDDRRGGFSFRWADLISIAAVLLLVGSVAFPLLDSVRSNAQQELCFENMHASANAFGLYAGSNQDMLPMATAGFGPTWMDVGSTPERSNSSNLFTLIRTENADLADLACPTNPNAQTGEAHPDAWDWNSLEEVSYSYRIMPPGGMKTTIHMPVGVVIMSDRSPVVLRIKQNLPVIPEQNSPNHNGEGQHMLMLDGSSRWSTSPILDGQDNIWLPRGIETVIHQARSKLGIMKGSELPDGPTDAFVGP